MRIKMSGAPTNFNWDDIEVGNDALDHSQKFFTMTHIKHERFDELIKMEQFQDLDLNDDHNGNKENDTQRYNCDRNVKCLKKECVEGASPTISKETLTQLHAEELNVDVQDKSSKVPSDTERPVSPDTTSSKLSARAVGKCPPSPPPPHAYQCKDLYQRRKDEAFRRRQEEERKMREFHSRPMPDFSAFIKKQQQRAIVHAITVPVTPMVLKKSREAEEKRNKKIEEIKRQMQPPKIEARPANVLKEPPFVPKKSAHPIVPCPFNLHSEKRLQERKQFNEATQRAFEERRKQVETEENERKQREEHHIKELRKLTKFKARPNPFK